MANINRVVLVGNLTRDPELRHTPSGTAVCKLRIAVNTRQKNNETGEWGGAHARKRTRRKGGRAVVREVARKPSSRQPRLPIPLGDRRGQGLAMG